MIIDTQTSAHREGSKDEQKEGPMTRRLRDQAFILERIHDPLNPQNRKISRQQKAAKAQ